MCGGIASGKSTVCDLLEKSGAYSIKADEIVHELLSGDELTINTIVDHFGKEILSEKTIDRKKLANLVFEDAEALHWLESLLHPKVIAYIKDRYKKISSNHSYTDFVVEFPLLFETGFDSWFDKIFVVDASESIRKQRFLAKGFSEDQYEKRSKRFLKKYPMNQPNVYLIRNNTSIDELKKTINQVLC